MFHHFQQQQQQTSNDNTLYDALKVNRNATSQEIKRAYYNLARTAHPDHKGGSNEEFQKINQAHEILIDENKRKIYDQHGMAGLQRGGNRGQANAADIFSQMFGSSFSGFGPGFSASGGNGSFEYGFSSDGGRTFVFTQTSHQNFPKKPQPISKTIDVTLEDVFSQKTFIIPIATKKKSSTTPPTLTDHVETCTAQFVNWEQLQSSILLKEKGNDVLEGNFVRGDIILKPLLTKGTVFTPCNTHDLIMFTNVTMEDSLCGFEFSIPFIDSNKTVLKFAFGTKGSTTENVVVETGMVFECSCGLPLNNFNTTDTKDLDFCKENYDKLGSLYIVFDVQPPTLWNMDRRRMLVNRLMNTAVSTTPKIPCKRASLEVESRLAKEVYERRLRNKQP